MQIHPMLAYIDATWDAARYFVPCRKESRKVQTIRSAFQKAVKFTSWRESLRNE
jgi:hypothetical protein